MAESKNTARLEKEIEELRAALEQKQVAEAKNLEAVRANEEYMKQPVTIKLFKDNGKYRDDVYVSVNEKSFLSQDNSPNSSALITCIVSGFPFSTNIV